MVNRLSEPLVFVLHVALWFPLIPRPLPPISLFSANGSRQTFLTRFSRSVSSKKKKHGATRAYFKSCDRAIIKLKNTNLSNYKKHLVLSKNTFIRIPTSKKDERARDPPRISIFQFYNRAVTTLEICSGCAMFFF